MPDLEAEKTGTEIKDVLEHILPIRSRVDRSLGLIPVTPLDFLKT